MHGASSTAGSRAPAKRRSAAPWLRCSVWGRRARVLLSARVLGLYARHWLSLARRSGVGARSEEDVQRALARLQVEGWRVRHSLRWQGRGEIDSVAIAPTGMPSRSRRRPEPTTGAIS